MSNRVLAHCEEWDDRKVEQAQQTVDALNAQRGENE